MNYTNLNIKNGTKYFKYIVEHTGESLNQNEDLMISNACVIYFKNLEYTNVIAQNDVFYANNDSYSFNDFIPESYKTTSFNLFFPRYSIDTYKTNVSYVVSFKTWINQKEIYLASVLLNRNNAYAYENGVKRFLDDNYFECVNISMLDPFDLIYSDNWKMFRSVVCGEKIEKDGSQFNNVVPNILIELTPVKQINNEWIKLDDFDSCSGIINISKNEMLNVALTLNLSEGAKKLKCDVNFNDYFDKNIGEYFKETYNINIFDPEIETKCFVAIKDKENIYKYKAFIMNNLQQSLEIDINDMLFNNWDEFVNGLYCDVLFILKKHDEDILVLKSNPVFVTQEVFKFLMNQEIQYVNLDAIDMEIKNFNIVNVIENKVVTVERPQDYKSNVIKSIFVKTQNTDAIQLHKNVTENICINLDAYKNKVNAFVLKIGETNFFEIGRMSAGVVFKVFGSQLGQETSGEYYILDDSGEMVTLGKYTII